MVAMTELVAVTEDVLVATSPLFVTNSTVLVGHGYNCLVVDPAVTVDELRALAAELSARDLRVVAGWSTHPHWDHVLWSAELGAAERFATAEATDVALRHHDDLVRQAEAAAAGHDADLIGRLTPLPAGAEELAWDGPSTRIVRHDGHARGHGALVVGAGVLLAGDMCSDIEIPLLDLDAEDPIGDYRAGLDLLAGVEEIRVVVPGHGSPGDVRELRRRIDCDRTYLDDLEHGRRTRDERLDRAPQWLRDEHDSQARWVANL